MVCSPASESPKCRTFPASIELLDRPGDLLDRDVGVDPVLVEEVDRLGPETGQRGLGHRPDVLGTAGKTDLPALVVDVEAELGGNHDLVAHGGQRLAHQFLVHERPVDLGRVEEGDPLLDRRPDQRHHLVVVACRSQAVAHAHAAQADGRDLQTAAAELTLLDHSAPSSMWGSVLP